MFDVALIGNGIIGVSAALELARSGASCALIGASEPGGGSGAAAGILAPSVGQRDAVVRGFYHHSLNLFPALLESLQDDDPDLTLLEGLLEVVTSPVGSPLEEGSELLDEAAVRRHEPALQAPFGGVLHPRDGAVDSTRLLAALRRASSRHPRIEMVGGGGAVSIDIERSPARVVTKDGASIQARVVVLAAGAWSPGIEGLPRSLPISPMKGQIIVLDAPRVVRRPVMSDHIYLVPRGNELVVGATSENAGFDTTTTDDAARSLNRSAIDLCPQLARASIVRRWAGLRPSTPDLLPILGPDPEYPALVYACGHSRNGILLAPATAEAVGSFCGASGALHPAVERLSVARFQTAAADNFKMNS